MPSEDRDALPQDHASLKQDKQDKQHTRPQPDDSKAVHDAFPLPGSPKGE